MGRPPQSTLRRVRGCRMGAPGEGSTQPCVAGDPSPLPAATSRQGFRRARNRRRSRSLHDRAGAYGLPRRRERHLAGATRLERTPRARGGRRARGNRAPSARRLRRLLRARRELRRGVGLRRTALVRLRRRRAQPRGDAPRRPPRWGRGRQRDGLDRDAALLRLRDTDLCRPRAPGSSGAGHGHGRQSCRRNRSPVPDVPLAEIEDMVGQLAGQLRGASSSNFLSSGDQQVLAAIEQDAAQWELLLDWEEEYCREPGALDSGTHLLFAVQAEG